MYNAWYRNNETLVGPLTESNELTLDMRAFLDYARQVKSSSNPFAKKVQRDTNLLLEDDESKQSSNLLPRNKYTLNEFMVGKTRMQYYDKSNYLGFPSAPYTSSLAIQNFERLVIHPDIGYYVDREGGSSEETNNENGNHSDYIRKYSPQEALNRVLTSPLFNGNNTKTILQSNKSERYYQLTFPLENCGRMYVMAAPMLPSYSVIQPWSHVCRLFQMNPVVFSQAHVVRIHRFPELLHLHENYGVQHVIRLPCGISVMNRRDPVIQEGSIELITTIFTYDNCDADIQFNNPYGCFNKHEDYDGDTNTQSIGKGVESSVEICYNMKRQTLPCIRAKSIVPQNILARLMLHFLIGVNREFANDQLDREVLSKIYSKSTLAIFTLNHVHFLRLKDETYAERKDDEDKVFAVELFRRVSICTEYITGRWRLAKNLQTARHVFGSNLLANLYMFFVTKRRTKIEHTIKNFATENLTTLKQYEDLEADAVRNVLHEMLNLWSPVSSSLISNCQTLIDDVFRAAYCALGEQACTNALDHCSRTVHTTFPNFFLDKGIFDLEYIVNVFSRAKGDFDSLLRMMHTVNKYMRDCRTTEALESSREKPLSLGKRDFFSRVSNKLLDKYINYTDKYVLGSKKIPKSCKQANSMKWAMQNVQYFDGQLWMKGEVILSDIECYFSSSFFIETNLLNMVVDSMIERTKDKCYECEKPDVSEHVYR